MTPQPIILAVILAVTVSTTAGAVDTVYFRTNEKRAAGKVTEVTKESVTVTPKIGDPTTIPASKIDRIEWAGEPPSQGLARSEEASGQYSLALKDYKTAQSEVTTDNEYLRNDIKYGIASTIGRMALADSAQQEEAITRLTAFKNDHPNHYRYYNALLLLGDVQMAKGDRDAAEVAFNLVTNSTLPNYRLAAKVKIGRVQLARDDVAGARATFDEVVKTSADSPAEKSRKFEAMLGQASCMQQQGQNEEAVQVLDKVIQECASSETRLQAEAYLRQGDAYAAMGQNTKQAIMAYLHVDVIPSLSREKDLHAEALYRLSQLWPVLGHPARADLAASKLQSEYPNSEWTQKLAGG